MSTSAATDSQTSVERPKTMVKSAEDATQTNMSTPAWSRTGRAAR